MPVLRILIHEHCCLVALSRIVEGVADPRHPPPSQKYATEAQERKLDSLIKLLNGLGNIIRVSSNHLLLNLCLASLKSMYAPKRFGSEISPQGDEAL